MGKFVKISASRPYRVFSGLQTKNKTSENPTNPNRLNVEALWTDNFVILKQGTWYYPAVVQTWDSVKALEKNEIITIGNEVDTIDDADKLAYANTCYDRVSKAYAVLEKKGFDNPMKEKETKKTTTKKQATSTKNLIDETNESIEE